MSPLRRRARGRPSVHAETPDSACKPRQRQMPGYLEGRSSPSRAVHNAPYPSCADQHAESYRPADLTDDIWNAGCPCNLASADGSKLVWHNRSGKSTPPTVARRRWDHDRRHASQSEPRPRVKYAAQPFELKPQKEPHQGRPFATTHRNRCACSLGWF